MGFVLGRRWHHMGQDITDGARPSVIDLVCRDVWMDRRHAVLQPFDAVDKAGLHLKHDQFDGVKIPSAGKASDKIVSSVDGRVQATAYGAGNSPLAVFVLDGSVKQGFNDSVDGDPVA